MTNNKSALVTGASKGLGYAIAEILAREGWNILINARNTKELLAAKALLKEFTEVIAVAGDVRDEIHLLELSDILKKKNWHLDLVVNNASSLGVSPLLPLLEHPVENLHTVFHTNMIAPISLLQKIRPYLNQHAQIINISSDAGKEVYEKWGAYGGSKAGLEHMTAILAKENPELYFYAFDPGDMRTDMHQEAFPGEDISDRPYPSEYAVPALLQLIEGDLCSGSYSTSSFERTPV